MSERVDVHFHGLASGGSAVGRVVGPEGDARLGMTAFVPFATPGERASVRIGTLHKRHFEGELLESVSGACPHFGVCGGCDLQHLPYERQLVLKREMVASALAAGGLRDVPVADVAASPPWGYRRRVTLHVDARGSIGYRPRRSHAIILPLACPVAIEPIEAFLRAGFVFAQSFAHGASLVLETDALGRLWALLRVGAMSEKEAKKAALALEGKVYGGAVEVGRKRLFLFGAAEENPTLGSFTQVNATVNAAIVEAIVALSEGAELAVDLYAGAGNFAVPLAQAGRGVAAVESDARLVAAGRVAAREAGVGERVLYYEQSVEKFLRRAPERADFVVADPPRAGLGPLALSLSFARTLALLSCDLAAGVRDLRALQESGWSLERVQPFDMFAQTGHIELLSVLRR